MTEGESAVVGGHLAVPQYGEAVRLRVLDEEVIKRRVRGADLGRVVDEGLVGGVVAEFQRATKPENGPNQLSSSSEKHEIWTALAYTEHFSSSPVQPTRNAPPRFANLAPAFRTPELPLSTSVFAQDSTTISSTVPTYPEDGRYQAQG